LQFGSKVDSFCDAGDVIAKTCLNFVDKKKFTSSGLFHFTFLDNVFNLGITWKKCVMSSTNRPSLGSWKGVFIQILEIHLSLSFYSYLTFLFIGWPWEIENIVNGSLSRNAIGANVKVVYSMIAPEFLVPPESAHLFKLVWSKEPKEGATVIDVAEEVRSAVTESEISKAKADSEAPKKGTGKKSKK
jgi:hypothetical protein